MRGISHQCNARLFSFTASTYIIESSSSSAGGLLPYIYPILILLLTSLPSTVHIRVSISSMYCIAHYVGWFGILLFREFRQEYCIRYTEAAMAKLLSNKNYFQNILFRHNSFSFQHRNGSGSSTHFFFIDLQPTEP